MKKYLTALVVAFSLIGAPTMAQDAQQNTTMKVDITKLDSQARDAVLKAVKEQNPIPVTSPAQVNEWAQAGKGIGDAIAAAAKSLNTGVNDFIKTPAGVLTIWVILGYLFGQQLVGLVLGPIIWVILGFVIWRSAMIFFRPYKKTLKDGTVIDRTFEWHSSDGKAFFAFLHIAAFIALSIVMLCVIFI